MLTTPCGRQHELQLENLVPVLPVFESKPSSSADVPVDVPFTEAASEPATVETDAGGNPDLKTDNSSAIPKEHSLTHFPKLASCEICARAKAQRKQCRKVSHGAAEDEDGREKPSCFGDLVTADHIVLGKEEEISRHDDTCALVILDRFTRWLDCFPLPNRSAESTEDALNKFIGPKQKVKRFYTDCSAELIAAARALGWKHDTATPQRPQTNGVAERAVRRVLEGTRSILLASGLPHRWWSEACRCFCFLRNIHDEAFGTNTPYWLRFEIYYTGFKIPFGALVDYKPSSKREASDVKKFDSRTLPGIFIGYHVHCGGKWSGDYLVLDVAAYKARTEGAIVPVHRIKEVIPAEPFSFPVREGTIESLASEQNESQTVLGESPSFTENEITPTMWDHYREGAVRKDDAEAVRKDDGPTDEWIEKPLMLIRVHRTPRKALFDPSLCEDSPPIPFDHIDVMRNTKTNLENADEMDLNDVWDGSSASCRQLSDYWTGETRFDKLFKAPPGYEVVEGRVIKLRPTARPPNVWPEVWGSMSRLQRQKAVERWASIAPKIEAARKRRGIIIGVNGADPADTVATATLGLAMPTVLHEAEHREKVLDYSWGVNDALSLVAKNIPIREAKAIPEAKAAMDKEWANLWKP